MTRRRYLRRGALLIVACAGAAGVAWWRAGHDGEGDTLGPALAAALADELAVDAASVQPLDGSPGDRRGWREVVFTATADGELPDVFRAEVRRVDGGVAGVRGVRNLTRSRSAAEGQPVRAGRFVAFPVEVAGQADAVTVLDTAGEPGEAHAGWPWWARLQNAVGNWQDTGRVAGFGSARYALRPPAAEVRVSASGDGFRVEVDGATHHLDPAVRSFRPAPDRVEVRVEREGRPGTITWVVDTVRKATGPEPIEWLEHRVFALRDGLRRGWYALAGDPGAADDANADMGVTEAERRRRAELSATDPEIGWPPRPLEPLFPSPLEGEGEWLPLVDDPFVDVYPNAPPTFAQTFLRPDRERGYVRIYLTAFDPRQVQLRVMTGTREPESATGETGRGRVPHDPDTLRRLVAAFNGGFQALHGEFGMMSEGRVYLPPKPWAATVAVRRDGQVAIGSWMPPPKGRRQYEEGWARAQIPEDVVEFRQNLTSVVEDGEYNPWGRWWWGAAPVNATEQTYIDRSGLCLTEEGFLVYFWGDSLGPDALGEAMLRARCVRGLHLDMNSRHTGFELYRTTPAAAPFEPLGRPLDPDTEFEGPYPGAPALSLRARRAVKSMTTMRFPRWVDRDPRDFFYLLRVPVLPGPDLPAAGLGPGPAGRWDATGLPHDGWPPAFARTFLGDAPGRRTWLVRIDPRRVTFRAEGRDPSAPAVPALGAPAPDAGPDGESTGAGAAGAEPLPPPPPRLAILSGAGASSPGAEVGLWRLPPGAGPRTGAALVGDRWGAGPRPEAARTVVAGRPLDAGPAATVALGVDGEGFLLYAEREPDDPVPLAERLRQAGVEQAIAPGEGVRLAFLLDGKTVGPDAFERPLAAGGALHLDARRTPRTDVLFPDVEPRGYWTWARMQDTRVRYFRSGPPRFTITEDGGVSDHAQEP